MQSPDGQQALRCYRFGGDRHRLEACAKTVAMLIFVVALPHVAQGQDRPSTFEMCMRYVSSLEEMGTKFTHHQAAGRKLIEERQNTFIRLAEAYGTIQNLLGTQMQANIALFETELEAVAAGQSLGAALELQQSFTPTPDDVRYWPEAQFNQFSQQIPIAKEARQAATHLANLRLQVDLIIQKLKTTQVEGNLASQRYIALLQELQRNSTELAGWQQKSVALFDQYWELADVAGVRSGLELRATLRILESAAGNNGGAMFVRAVALMRLERYEEALPLFNRLLTAPAIRGIVLAARAELWERMQKTEESNIDMRHALASNRHDPRIRLHRAQALAAADDLRAAEREWEAVLELGGHEIAARRAVALINASFPAPSKRNQLRALENANLASQLSGDDWASTVALALATAINGQSTQAVEYAQQACELAVGENEDYCLELIDGLEAGRPVAWSF